MTARKKPRPAPAPPPPPPAKLVHEGFGLYQTPDPSSHMFSPPNPRGPWVGNGLVSIYRYRVTVERIEEPRDVLLARMVELYRSTTNHHHHETLAAHARRKFDVSLWELVDAAPPPAPPAPESGS